MASPSLPGNDSERGSGYGSGRLGLVGPGNQFRFSFIDHPESNSVVPDVDFIPNHELAKYDPDADIQTDVIPSLVVEILSPSTRHDDLGSKKEFYRQAGVEEYWVIDIESRQPKEQKVMKFRLQEEPDRPVETIPFTGSLTSLLFPGFALDLENASRELSLSYGKGWKR